MSYNGWSNYETWNVSLWLNNEQPTYFYLRELANEEDKSDYEKAQELRDFVADHNPLAEDASMFSDILGAALSDVDYREIIEGAKDE
jgi:hypothetical protein